MRTLKCMEDSRRYEYPDGTDCMFDNIVAVEVTKSGFHKLESKDGDKYIVAPGWRYIEIVTKEWSF